MKIIVGGGIAGSLLTYHFLRNGFKCLLVTSIPNRTSSASLSALGLLNPLVGKYLTHPNHYETFFPFSEEFYKQLENEFGNKFIQKIPIARIDDASGKELLKSKIKEITKMRVNYWEDENTIQYDNSATIYCENLINSLHNYFAREKVLINTPWEYCIRVEEQPALQGHTNIEEVIFCQGNDIINNPWFNYLPWDLNKGETILVKTKNKQDDSKVYKNRNYYCIPCGNNTYKHGSTFTHDIDNLEPSQESQEDLLKSFDEIFPKCKEEREVIERTAAIRCYLPDKLPIFGQSPINPRYFCFSGLGAKGYLWSPLLSKFIFEYFTTTITSPILNEYSIERYNLGLTKNTRSVKQHIQSYVGKFIGKIYRPVNILTTGDDVNYLLNCVKNGTVWIPQNIKSSPNALGTGKLKTVPELSNSTDIVNWFNKVASDILLKFDVIYCSFNLLTVEKLVDICNCTFNLLTSNGILSICTPKSEIDYNLFIQTLKNPHFALETFTHSVKGVWIKLQKK